MQLSITNPFNHIFNKNADKRELTSESKDAIEVINKLKDLKLSKSSFIEHLMIEKKFKDLENMTLDLLSKKDQIKANYSLIDDGIHLCKRVHHLPFNLSVTRINGNLYVHISDIKIASGAEKIVQLAINIDKGELVALGKRKFNQDYTNHSDVIVMNKGCNEYVAKIYDCFTYISEKMEFDVNFNRNVYLTIMKLYPQGDATKDTHGRCKAPDNLLISWSLSIAKGLKEFHHHFLTHNDLKPDNFFLDETGQGLVLGDFGFVVEWNDNETFKILKPLGTPLTWAPEKLKRKEFNFIEHKRCDIYSLGICFYIFFTGRAIPWQNTSGKAFNIDKCTQTDFNNNFPEPVNKRSFLHLCWSMVQRDPIKRPTIDEVIMSLEKLQFNM